ncbi:hypothetical protein CAC42_3451 [Sphaceloma murrayae]|uniref:2Fe-2S ferredoxin-type domain-containing protein n=1 Tax=Sphaceloma murrayae TaxID=2082308 RepID=A0A2K1R1N9_9PEZI|nr:hypothetical protein CAC42_3451 [Sphaceloma murrayae]
MIDADVDLYRANLRKYLNLTLFTVSHLRLYHSSRIAGSNISDGAHISDFSRHIRPASAAAVTTAKTSSGRAKLDSEEHLHIENAIPLAHGHIDPPAPGEERHVTFIDKDGSSHTFEVSDGSNLLDIAQANDVEMEGACGGSCACSTCHVIVDDGDMYDKMEEPDDDENDMLDLAFGLTETSRLGCQIKMSKELDGLVVRLPSMTRNLQASDFAKK